MKKMKVIGINASPREKRSNTLRLTNAVLTGANEEGAETELIDLYQLKIDYCTGCEACYVTGECTLFDDFSDVFEKMMDAQGIVLGAPNYVDNVPAPMKAFFDRMSDAIHCQMFTGKFGCSVCTAGGEGANEVVGCMNKTLMTLGANVVGGVGVNLGGDPSALGRAESDALVLGKNLAKSIRGDITYPDQDAIHLKTREYFAKLITFNKDRFVHEYEWYEQMGWVN